MSDDAKRREKQIHILVQTLADMVCMGINALAPKRTPEDPYVPQRILECVVAELQRRV
jgi:hypothetical protein